MTKKKAERGSLEFYLEQKYPVTLYPDPDGGYVAEIKDLPGCMTQGETAEEAMVEVEDARMLWIETAYEHGDDIPLPSTETQYSGKTLLRMPRSLHQKLAEGAEREGVSLNQHIVSLLSEANATKTIEPFKEKVEAIYRSLHSRDVFFADPSTAYMPESSMKGIYKQPVKTSPKELTPSEIFSFSKAELAQIMELQKDFAIKVQKVIKISKVDTEEVSH